MIPPKARLPNYEIVVAIAIYIAESGYTTPKPSVLLLAIDLQKDRAINS